MSARRLTVLVLALPLLLLLLGSVAQATIHVKGSDTIGGALGPALARAYMARHPDTDVIWGSLGSGTAFVGLFDGTADLGASSRSIKPSELEEAERLGIELEEYILGYDGIAVLVHPSNPVESFDLDTLGAVFRGEISDWSRVGGSSGPIRRISRPSYSGTHGFFAEHVLGRGGGAESFAADTEFIEHSEDIVEAVAADPGAIAYLGMGWRLPGVRAVPVATERGASAVLPTLQTVRDGTYPIFRPLLLYARRGASGETLDLLRFVFGDGQRLVTDNGFIPADIPVRLRAHEERADGDPADEVTRVFFSYGGVRLGDDALATIESFARRAAQEKGRVLVVGHSDVEGTPAANRTTSRRRAQVVAQVLVRYGVAQNRLEVEWRSSEQPIATNETLVGRSRNRRVDLRVLPNSE